MLDLQKDGSYRDALSHPELRALIQGKDDILYFKISNIYSTIIFWASLPICAGPGIFDFFT
jgi:hypothetical protein